MVLSLTAACVFAAWSTAAGRSSIVEPPAGAKPHCRKATTRVGSPRAATSAVVRERVRIYRRPGRHPFATFGRLNQNDFPTVFRVLAAVRSRDCRTAWYRVQVPLRPNGVTGFVRARGVELGVVHTRIQVSISKRRLTLFRNGRAVLRTRVAVGAPATPTPTGSYYVNQRLIPSDPSGPFGPAALGVSAFSKVLRNWTQGGPIGIHGTNEPWSIGHAASNGCIRLPNPMLRRLFRATPAGTPVLIRR